MWNTARRRWVASLAALSVPAVAVAHGQEAIALGLCLPVLVVPVVFLGSLWSWRASSPTKLMTAVLLVLVGAAIVAMNLALAERPLLISPRIMDVLWWAWPIAAQGATWAVFACWSRRRDTKQA